MVVGSLDRRLDNFGICYLVMASERDGKSYETEPLVCGVCRMSQQGQVFVSCRAWHWCPERIEAWHGEPIHLAQAKSE